MARPHISDEVGQQQIASSGPDLCATLPPLLWDPLPVAFAFGLVPLIRFLLRRLEAVWVEEAPDHTAQRSYRFGVWS